MLKIDLIPLMVLIDLVFVLIFIQSDVSSMMVVIVILTLDMVLLLYVLYA